MSSRRSAAAVVVAATAASLGAASRWPSEAAAHVAPSPDVNNRYLKVTLLGDRVRVAYLVFYGETPGHALRARLDEDGSGIIDPAEAARFGEEVRQSLAVRAELDGRPTPGSWRVVDVGLGTPTTQGGSFSVDLVLELPATPGAHHRLLIADGGQIELPGESELRIEESPGVRAVAAHHPAEAKGLRLAWAFTGNPRSADDRAVVVDYVSDTSAPRGATEPVPAAPTPPAPQHAPASSAPPGRAMFMIGGSVIGLGLAVVSAVRARRRRKRLLSR